MTNFNQNDLRRRFYMNGTSVDIAELINNVHLQTIQYIDANQKLSSVTLQFQKPYPTINETHIFYFYFMFMLAKHVYPRIHKGGTFIQLVLEVRRDKEDIAYKCNGVFDIDSKLFTLSHPNRGIIPLEEVAPLIYKQLSVLNDWYKPYKVGELAIMIYSDSSRKSDSSVVIQTDEQVLSDLEKMGLLEATNDSTMHQNQTPDQRNESSPQITNRKTTFDINEYINEIFTRRVQAMLAGNTLGVSIFTLLLNALSIKIITISFTTWNHQLNENIRLLKIIIDFSRCISPRLHSLSLYIEEPTMQQLHCIECGDSIVEYGIDSIEMSRCYNNRDLYKIFARSTIHSFIRNYSTIPDGKKNLLPQMRKLTPFIIVNILTQLYMNRYLEFKIPYSAAFIMVRANQPLVLNPNHIFTTVDSPVMIDRPNQLSVMKEMKGASTDKSPVMNMLTERGSHLVHSLLTSLTRVVKNERRSINVYFTSFNRDEGYRLLRNSILHYHDLNLNCSPLTRYNNLSNMRVYSSVNKRLLFKVRDINDLLTYIRVDELVNLFCREHCSSECNTKMISSHNHNQSDYIKYMMIHDIMLYAAIMQKAQELHWRNFQIDLFYKQNIAEKVKKTPNLWIANIYKTFACSNRLENQERKEKRNQEEYTNKE